MKDIIVVRMATNEKELLKSISSARGENLSDFVRRAIRKELAMLGYLSESHMKALGIRKIPRERVLVKNGGEIFE